MLGRKCDWVGVSAMLIAVLTASASTTLEDAEDTDLPRQSLKRNKAAIELIHTFQCKIAKTVFHTGKDQKTKTYPKGSYWKEGTSFRSKWEKGNQWSEIIVKGLQLRSRSNDGRNSPHHGVESTYNGLPLYEGDPWLETLVMFPCNWRGKPMPVYLLDTIEYPRLKIAAKKESIANHASVIVSAQSPDGLSQSHFTLNVEKNYLLSKAAITFNNKGVITESVTMVERFEEPSPGIFFPSLVTKTYAIDGQIVTRDELRLSDIIINAPLSPAAFELDFKAGDQIQDSIKGTRFEIGPDGKAVINEKPIGKPSPPVGGKEPARFTETKVETASLAYRIFTISCFILLVGCAFKAIAMLRDRRRSSLSVDHPRGSQ